MASDMAAKAQAAANAALISAIATAALLLAAAVAASMIPFLGSVIAVASVRRVTS
jgi:C4-dicarboxylate transporter